MSERADRARRAADSPEWRAIPVTSVHVGDIVSVRGIRDRQSAVVHVRAVDKSRELVVIEGRRPWGGGFRDVRRECHPEGRVELLVEDNDPHEGTR